MASIAPAALASPIAINALSSVDNCMDRLPAVMYRNIGKFLLVLNQISYRKFPKDIRDYVCLSLVNRTVKTACQAELTKINTIWKLLNKYKNSDIGRYVPDHNPDAGDTLSSAVSSGSFHVPWMSRAFNTYKEENGRDILQIADLMPESMHLEAGSTRTLSRMIPLELACLNEKIPPSVIAGLIDRGSNPHHLLYSVRGYIHILQILHGEYPDHEVSNLEDRLKKITDIFLAHKVTLEKARESAKAATVKKRSEDYLEFKKLEEEGKI